VRIGAVQRSQVDETETAFIDLRIPVLFREGTDTGNDFIDLSGRESGAELFQIIAVFHLRGG